MSEHSKQYDNLEEMMIAGQAMGKFQSIHNVIRKDYAELLLSEQSLLFQGLCVVQLTQGSLSRNPARTKSLDVVEPIPHTANKIAT